MSEDTPNQGEGTTPDPINNLKAEFGRKFDNIKQEMAASNQALLAQLQSMAAPKAPVAPAADELEDLWYKEPAKAAALIEQRAMEKIQGKIDAQQQYQAKTNQTLQTLVKDFPELSDDNNALTKRAVEIYTSYDNDEKKSPMAMKLAVKEAAAELDVKPISKRASADEYYSSNGSGSYQASSDRKSSRKADLDPRTVAFAKLVGLDTDNAKVMESLKNRAKRTNWTKWE